MLHSDNIISESASEAVEKIPTDKTYCGSEQRVYRFPSGNKLADAREGGG